MKNLKNRKGSLILSLMASGAVAATIVAAHQVAQNASEGSGQGWGRQQAYHKAQRALSAASYMVSRSIISCRRGKIASAGTFSDEPKCQFIDDDNATDVKSEWNINLSGACGSSCTQGVCGATCTSDVSSCDSKNNVCYSKGSFLLQARAAGRKVFLEKNMKILFEIKKGLDPAVQAVFNSLPGYICQKEGSYEIQPNLKCPELNSAWDMNQITGKKAIQCQNSGGTDQAGTVCNYFPAGDYDWEMVFITVEVPYAENEDSTQNKKVVIKGAIRRPPAFISMKTKTSASVRLYSCETPTMVAGIESYMCVEKYGSGGPHITTPASVELKNYGPGRLYDFKFRREDLEVGTQQLLGQGFYHMSKDSSAPTDGLKPGDTTDFNVSVANKFRKGTDDYYNASTVAEFVNCSCMDEAMFVKAGSEATENKRLFDEMCRASKDMDDVPPLVQYRIAFTTASNPVSDFGVPEQDKDQTTPARIATTNSAHTNMVECAKDVNNWRKSTWFSAAGACNYSTVTCASTHGVNL